MNKEEKLLFVVSLMPLFGDYLNDLINDHPKIFKQNIKKSANELITELEKVGQLVTMFEKKEDMVHLGISKEIIKTK